MTTVLNSQNQATAPEISSQQQQQSQDQPPSLQPRSQSQPLPERAAPTISSPQRSQSQPTPTPTSLTSPSKKAKLNSGDRTVITDTYFDRYLKQMDSSLSRTQMLELNKFIVETTTELALRCITLCDKKRITMKNLQIACTIAFGYKKGVDLFDQALKKFKDADKSKERKSRQLRANLAFPPCRIEKIIRRANIHAVPKVFGKPLTTVMTGVIEHVTREKM